MLDKNAFDIIGKYYAASSRGSSHAPGGICDTTVYYLPPGPLNALSFDIEAANRGEPIKYDVVPATETSFKHKPVLRPRPLEYDEAFVVAKAKRRPVVILSEPVVPPVVAGLPRQDFPDAFLVCPFYSFRDNHPPEFRLRLEAWEWSVCFHVPASQEFAIHEGFLRFDRCLVVPQAQLRLRGVNLPENALLALYHCLSWFMTGNLTLISRNTEGYCWKQSGKHFSSLKPTRTRRTVRG